MPDFSIAINHGDIYLEDGMISDGQLLVDGEVIVSVSDTVAEGVGARRVIDASGMAVLPGAIDTHSHHREPGFTHKEDIASGTAAAAAGGVTVSVGMPNVNPPTSTAGDLRNVLAAYEQRSIVDYNHNPLPLNVAEVPAMTELGVLGFKVFMVVDSKRGYPHMPGIGVHDNGSLLEVAEAVHGSGRVLMVHPNDQSVQTVLERRAWSGGDFSYRSYAAAEAASDGLAWNLAVAALIEIQHSTGVALHVLHMMGPRMLRLCRLARQAGQDVTTEVNPFALFLSDIANVDRLGPLGLGRCIPQDWVRGMWEGIVNGEIDVLGSDHAPHTLAEKEVGWTDMWKAPSGTPQLQHYLPRLLTAARQGMLEVHDVVRITATNPSKRFGLYPKKGAIRVGADADLVLVSLVEEQAQSDERVLSRAGYNPYRGERLVGVPSYTLVRGSVVWDQGHITGRPGFGKQARPVGAPWPAESVVERRPSPSLGVEPVPGRADSEV